MNENGYFICYETFYVSLKELPDDLRLKFYDYIWRYGLYGEEPELSGLEKAVWVQIEFSIKNSKNRREASKENGAKGGRPKVEQAGEPQQNPSENLDNLEEPNEKTQNPSENLDNLTKPNEKNRNLYRNEIGNEIGIGLNTLPPEGGGGEPPKKTNHYKQFFEKKINKNFETPISDWLKYKNAKRQSYPNLVSLLKMQDQLIKLSDNNPQEACRIVNNSIANSYSGLFASRARASPEGNNGFSEQGADSYYSGLDYEALRRGGGG